MTTVDKLKAERKAALDAADIDMLDAAIDLASARDQNIRTAERTCHVRAAANSINHALRRLSLAHAFERALAIQLETEE